MTTTLVTILLLSTTTYYIFIDSSHVLKFTSEWIIRLFIKILLYIDDIIYWGAAKAYQVFIKISEVNLFSDNTGEMLNNIVDRIYVILGVVMLFVLAYEILKLIIDPDSLSKTDNNSAQGIFKNLVITIVLLTFMPTAFNYLSKIQDNILKQNVIGNIFLGSSTGENNDDTTKSSGRKAAISIYSAFFHPKDADAIECEQMLEEHSGSLEELEEYMRSEADNENYTPQMCAEYLRAMYKAQEDDNTSEFIQNNNLINGVLSGDMTYKPILSAIAGIIAAWMFISYALDAGVRVAKLAFYQIIAPVPIVCRIFKPDIFNKWKSEFIKVYLELFLRVATVYFAIYVISLLPNLKLLQGGPLTIVIIILGLLKFAKDAPKMIEDLFSIKLAEVKIKKKLKDNEYAQKAAGVIGAGFIGGQARAANRLKIARENNGSKIGAILGGFAGGAIGSGRRAFKGNYENGIGSVIKNAFDESNKAGKQRDMIREKGDSVVSSRINDKIETLNEKRKEFFASGKGESVANEINIENLKEFKNTADGVKNSITKNQKDVEIINNAKTETLKNLSTGELKRPEAIIRVDNATGYTIWEDEQNPGEYTLKYTDSAGNVLTVQSQETSYDTNGNLIVNNVDKKFTGKDAFESALKAAFANKAREKQAAGIANMDISSVQTLVDDTMEKLNKQLTDMESTLDKTTFESLQKQLDLVTNNLENIYTTDANGEITGIDEPQMTVWLESVDGLSSKAQSQADKFIIKKQAEDKKTESK